MLVVEGLDGWGRDYVSQVVLARDDGGRTVPLREPAFWYGIGYSGTKVVGATSWSAAYAGDDLTAPDHTRQVLARARAACPAA